MVDMAGTTARPPHQFVIGRVVNKARRVARRPWSRLFPRLLTDAALLRATKAPSIDGLWERRAAGPFFLLPANRQRFVQRFRAAYAAEIPSVVAAADRAVRHEFDLL